MRLAEGTGTTSPADEALPSFVGRNAAFFERLQKLLV